jgi:hypothetical protein
MWVWVQTGKSNLPCASISNFLVLGGASFGTFLMTSFAIRLAILLRRRGPEPLRLFLLPEPVEANSLLEKRIAARPEGTSGTVYREPQQFEDLHRSYATKPMRM